MIDSKPTADSMLIMQRRCYARLPPERRRSLFAKSCNRIQKRRTACRQESSDETHQEQRCGRHCKRYWIVRWYAVELAGNKVPAGQRCWQTGSEADQYQND